MVSFFSIFINIGVWVFHIFSAFGQFLIKTPFEVSALNGGFTYVFTDFVGDRIAFRLGNLGDIGGVFGTILDGIYEYFISILGVVGAYLRTFVESPQNWQCILTLCVFFVFMGILTSAVVKLLKLL